MTVSVVGTPTTNNTGASAATSIAITAPSGLVTGNVLVAFMYMAAPTNVTWVTPTSPAWTQLGLNTPNSNEGNTGIYLRTITGSEPGSYTWTVTSTAEQLGGIVVQLGGATGNDGSPVFGGNATSGTSAVAPSITPGSGNTADFWLAFFGTFDGATVGTPTAPTGFSLVGSWVAAGDQGGYLYARQQSSSAATGTATATLGSSDTYASASALIVPSGGAAGPLVTKSKLVPQNQAVMATAYQ